MKWWVVTSVCAAMLALAGCSTGHDAVAQGGTFEFVAPGGKYPTTVIPSTVVLDREHRVAAVFLRELLADDLQPVVARLAAEPAPTSAPGQRQ